MSTVTTQQASTTPPARQPSASRKTSSKLWIVLWLLLGGFVAVVVFGVVLVLAGDGSTGTSSEPAEVADSNGSELAPTLTSDSDVLVRAFARAWEGGDWAVVEDLSNDSVAATAREWYVDGNRIEVVDPMTERGGELLVTHPRGGSALIFNLAVDTASGSPGIVDLVLGADAGGSTGTAQPAQTEHELTVTQPQPGDLFPSGSSITGLTTTETIEYRLLAEGTSLASGTVATDEGAFTTTVSFTNTCCIEMSLEIIQPGVGLTTIPLSYPEPG